MLKDISKFALSALSGLLLIASFPNDVAFIPEIPWLAWLYPIAFLAAAGLASRPREAFLIGYFSGVISHAAILYWLISFGPIPVVLLTLSYSIFPGVAAVFAWFMFTRISPVSWWWVFPTGSAAILFAEATGLWGFPWVFPMHGLAKMPVFIQSADIGGAALVGFIVALCGVTFYQAIFRRGDIRLRTRALTIGIVVFLLNYGYGVWRMSDLPAGLPVTAGLVQGGIESDVQWTQDYNRMVVDVYTDATERGYGEGEVDFFVWPESAIGTVAERDDKYSIPAKIRSLPRIVNAPLLMGVTTFDGISLFNSAILLNGSGEFDGFSDKCILIPFGEVVPFGKLAKMLPFPWGDYDINRGVSMGVLNVPLEKDGSTVVAAVATAICFDSIKPFILRSQVADGANIIVIITNNSWYKLPSGTEQHSMLDAFRAVENRRWTLRCSTTGVSHLIDPSGRILESTPQLSAGFLRAEAELLTDETIYTRHGELFGWIVFFAGVLIFAWMLALGEVENYV